MIVQNVRDNHDMITEIKTQMNDIVWITGASQSGVETFIKIAKT